jgi:hypothetical protein
VFVVLSVVLSVVSSVVLSVVLSVEFRVLLSALSPHFRLCSCCKGCAFVVKCALLVIPGFVCCWSSQFRNTIVFLKRVSVFRVMSP